MPWSSRQPPGGLGWARILTGGRGGMFSSRGWWWSSERALGLGLQLLLASLLFLLGGAGRGSPPETLAPLGGAGRGAHPGAPPDHEAPPGTPAPLGLLAPPSWVSGTGGASWGSCSSWPPCSSLLEERAAERLLGLLLPVCPSLGLNASLIPCRPAKAPASVLAGSSTASLALASLSAASSFLAS